MRQLGPWWWWSFPTKNVQFRMEWHLTQNTDTVIKTVEQKGTCGLDYSSSNTFKCCVNRKVNVDWCFLMLFQILNLDFNVFLYFKLFLSIFRKSSFCLIARKSKRWQVSWAPTGYICSSCCEICGLDGVLYSTVPSQRFREGKVGDQRVRINLFL